MIRPAPYFVFFIEKPPSRDCGRIINIIDGPFLREEILNDKNSQIFP
jgi:hypothetical protein